MENAEYLDEEVEDSRSSQGERGMTKEIFSFKFPPMCSCAALCARHLTWKDVKKQGWKEQISCKVS